MSNLTNMKIDIKVLLTALVTPLLISCAGIQDLAPDGSSIPIGVNTIIIHSDKQQDEAYSEIGSFLINQGYSIDNTAPEFFSLSTDYQSASEGYGLLRADVNVSISASVSSLDNGSAIILTARVKNGLADESRVEQKGQSGSVLRIAWDEFYSLAKTFSQNLTFETR